MMQEDVDTIKEAGYSEAQILEIDQGVSEIDNNLAATFGMLGEMLDLTIPLTQSLILPDPPLETQIFLNYHNRY
jgi:hypothetical protein